MECGDLVAVVANCGDSRLLTDDGSGSSRFRSVTRDHRPSDPLERQRLEALVERGQANLVTTTAASSRLPQPLNHHQTSQGITRIYPGGLGVSRTVGDVGFSAAAVPTPDVYRLPLLSTESNRESAMDESVQKQQQQRSQEQRTIRFVLATDGLFDVMNNQDVGVLAARQDSQGRDVAPGVAVDAIMTECLRRTGGHHDDTTVLVVDVNVPVVSSPSS